MAAPNRLRLRFQEDGWLALSNDAGAWKKKFGSLFQALQFAQSLSNDGKLRMTVSDVNGREIVETFV